MSRGPTNPLHVDLAAITFLGIASAVGYFLAVRPALGVQARAMFAERSIESSGSELARLDREVGATRVSLNRAEQELESLDVRLHPQSYRNQKLNEIAELGAGLGLVMEENTSGEPTPLAAARGLVAVPFVVGGRGGYASTTEFLSTLHREHRDLLVTGLRVASGDATASGESRFRVELTWKATVE